MFTCVTLIFAGVTVADELEKLDASVGMADSIEKKPQIVRQGWLMKRGEAPLLLCLKMPLKIKPLTF
jgi:hypothetical protein